MMHPDDIQADVLFRSCRTRTGNRYGEGIRGFDHSSDEDFELPNRHRDQERYGESQFVISCFLCFTFVPHYDS